MSKKKARTVQFQPGERNVFLHLLTACNLSCSHCYINRQEHGERPLSREQIKNCIELFADPGKKSNIIFLGGEPTLHKDLSFAVGFAKQSGFTTTVDTNGYLFNDFLARTTPQQLDFLSFSLDGPTAEINDPIRGEGVFEVCTTNIKKAVAAGFQVSLIYTVSTRNIDGLAAMVPLLKHLGVKKFFIQVLGLRGNSAQSTAAASNQVSRKEWLALVPEIAERVAAQGIPVTYPKVFLNNNEKFECAGNVAENYFIFPNGRVYQCPLCEDHPIHSYRMEGRELLKEKGIREADLFQLSIPEGCVMNKLLQPSTLEYDGQGQPRYRVSCCLLKKEIG